MGKEKEIINEVVKQNPEIKNVNINFSHQNELSFNVSQKSMNHENMSKTNSEIEQTKIKMHKLLEE